MAWIWTCTYDKGHGVDREACSGGSKKVHETEQGVVNAALRHANKPGYYFGNQSHFSYIFIREVTPTGRPKTRGRCYKLGDKV